MKFSILSENSIESGKFMSEPIFIPDLRHLEVSCLNEAIQQVPTGNALIYTLKNPSTLFYGTIPRTATVLWRNKKEEWIKSLSSQWTYFHWGHIIEQVLVTGLVQTQFQLPSYLIKITFFIYDPMIFSFSVNLNELKKDFLDELYQCFETPKNRLNPVQLVNKTSKTFFEINRKFKKYGIAITELEPKKI